MNTSGGTPGGTWPPPARPRQGDRRALPIAALAAIGLVAVALAVAAGGVTGPIEHGDRIDRGSSLARGALGAAVGLVLFGAALLVASRAGWLRDRRVTAALLVAAAALCFAFGALTGVGSASSDAAGRDEAPPTTTERRSGNAGTAEFDPHARAAHVDNDHDGEPDRDRDGNLIVVLDADGDGVPESTLVPCPGSPLTGGRDSTDRPSGSVAIDNDCDGTVDAYVTFSPKPLTLPQLPPIAAPPPTAASAPPTTRAEEDDDGGSSSSGVIVTLLVLLGSAALLGAGLWALRRWSLRTPVPSRAAPSAAADDTPAVDTAAVDAAIESSIDTLLGHPDPRVAIRAAYAVLLDALAEAGFPRQASEPPAEHLARCLRGLRVQPEPMRRLLELFSVARFSTHPMTEGDRATALDALRASRAQLVPATPFPPPTVPSG